MFDIGFAPKRSPRFGVLTGMLSLVVAMLTTFSIEHAAAIPAEAQVGKDSEESKTSGAVERALAPILPAERDFIYRILNCPVTVVEDDHFAAILTVHGQVVDAEGIPVAGATVVLRESSDRRAALEPDKYRFATDRERIRIPDVLARTITDREGRFRFDEVKSPAYPPQVTALSTTEPNLLAAHPAIGVGYFELPRTRETRIDHKEIALTLRPTSSIIGRFITEAGTPLSGATVRLEGLTQPSSDPSPTDGHWQLLMSQLAPMAETGPDGEFHLEGLPQGLVAIVSADHASCVTTRAAIATSDDVHLGERGRNGGRLRGQSIVASPAEVIADPGVKASGRVIDPQGMPIADAVVRYHHFDDRVQTDDLGEYTTRLSTSVLSRIRKDGRSTTSIRVDRDGYLVHTEEVSLDGVEAGSPLSVTLRPGVLVQGRVIDEDGDSVAGMVVRAIGHSTSEMTDANGHYKMYLPAEPQVLAVGTFDPSYLLPGVSELTRARSESDYGQWPHLVVDLSDGVVQQLPPITVSRRKPIIVVATLPDGSPAVGAVMVVKDEEPIDQPVAGQGDMPPFIVTKSNQVTADQDGRAELLLHRYATPNAVIEIGLARERDAYFARQPLKDSVDGHTNVTLQPAVLVEGRVFVEKEAAKGAEVELTEVTPFGKGQSTLLPTMVKQNHLRTMTDEDGWYRIAVQPGVKCHTQVRRVGDDSIRGSGRVRMLAITGNRTRAPDIVLRRGHLTIAGVVQDPDGKPLSGVTVRIGQRQVDTSLWIGHEQNSEFETDASGRFRLAHVPEGVHELWIHSGADRGQRSEITTVQAKAGDENVTILQSTGKFKALPRLDPLRVEPVAPAKR